MAVSIKANIDNVIKGLDQEKANAEKVVSRTIGDMRSRGPGWVSKAVREEYNISAKDVKAACHVEKAGTISISGTMVDDIALVYRGRVLTPTHFKMKPSSRPPGPYTVTAEIKRGQRKALSSIAFLAHSGGSSTKEIPFQRQGQSRLPIEAIKTISVPQMVQDGDGDLKPGIEEAINNGLESRFNHYCKQYLNK